MKAFLVAGLGFGDEGKGSIVDALCRRYKADLVVRYNGGAQAAHHVYDDNGRVHCFSQFGAGHFAGARTYLSHYMMIEPLGLLNEANHLQQLTGRDPFEQLYLSYHTPIITPYHRALGQVREQARTNRHGSCGMGIGELGSDLANLSRDLVVCAGDFWRKKSFSSVGALDQIRWRKYQEAKNIRNDYDHPLFDTKPAFLAAQYEEILSKAHLSVGMPNFQVAVFEGAQGVLLDEWHGFHPHTTWSNITFDNADNMLLGHHVQTIRIGVLRAYVTRHGEGPMPTQADGMTLLLGNQEQHNSNLGFQGHMRFGHFDAVLARYALRVVNGVDYIALTCLDQIDDTFPVVNRYKQRWTQVNIKEFKPLRRPDLQRQEKLTKFLLEDAFPVLQRIETTMPRWVASALGVPVGIRSLGPKCADKRFNMQLDYDHWHAAQERELGT